MSRLWNNAQEAAMSARLLFDIGSSEGAVNRAFYATFNAARALLESRGVDAGSIRNHAKVRVLLGQHFVEPGLIESSLVRALKQADKVRWNADFKPESVGPEVVLEQLDIMDQFMRHAAGLMDSAETAP